MKILPLIHGPTCPSCGRDNAENFNICTSDDCPGVRKCSAAGTMFEVLAELEERLGHNDDCPRLFLDADECNCHKAKILAALVEAGFHFHL